MPSVLGLDFATSELLAGFDQLAAVARAIEVKILTI